MSKARVVSPLKLYHIYNRGNNKEFIFDDPKHKKRFLHLNKHYLKFCSIEIHAYCIMNNHFHILLKGSLHEISQFMKNTESKFAEYYNLDNNRSGHVFQGRFNSRAVFSNKQYIQLIRYIFRNPIKANIVTDPFAYEWNSIGKSNKEHNIVTNKRLLDFLDGQGKVLTQILLQNIDDDKIAYFEKQKFSDVEAIDFYKEHLIINNVKDINTLLAEDENKAMNIIKKCRYYGITIIQLHKITGLELAIIKSASPQSSDYI